MDTTTTPLLVMTLVMLGVTWKARRLGNERRDVALLAVTTSLPGAGSTALTVI